MPDPAQGAGAVDPGDRQECRGADADRRPALSDRAGQGGVVGHLGGACRGAAGAAPVFGDLVSHARAYIAARCGRAPTKASSNSAISGWNTAWSVRILTGRRR